MIIDQIRKAAEAAEKSDMNSIADAINRIELCVKLAIGTVPTLCDALEVAINYISVGGHFPNNKCGCAECESLNKVLARIDKILEGAG